MIRSVATLFAKKTAVVAVSGVVILGGATLALAADGEDSSSSETTTTTPEETTTTTVDDTTTTTESTTTTTEAPEQSTTTEPDEGLEPTDADSGDDLAAEVEDANHGEVVSEAARVTCWEQAYLDYYGNHGQCVKTFAHGEGLTLEELEAAIAARDAEQAAQVTEPADDGPTSNAATQSSKPGKGKGNGHGGKGGGKGNGKKG